MLAILVTLKSSAYNPIKLALSFNSSVNGTSIIFPLTLYSFISATTSGEILSFNSAVSSAATFNPAAVSIELAFLTDSVKSLVVVGNLSSVVIVTTAPSKLTFLIDISFPSLIFN